MCLLKVKEELNSEPVRVKEVRRVQRSYSPEPLRTARYSSTRVVEERRPASNIPPPDPAPLPPPPPSYSAGPPPDPPGPPPPRSACAYHESTKIENRRTSRAPSARQSTITVEPERAPSKHTSHAPSVRSPTQASYVEVSHEPESPAPSSSGPSGDVRSQSTRRTSNTHKSATTRKSSVSKPTAPVSEYSEHEKEFRRERTYSGGRPRQEFETYQYVNAPPNFGRRSEYDDPRASRGSYGRRSSRLLIEDTDRYVRQREYTK